MSVALSRRAFLRGSVAVTAGLCASYLCNDRAAAVIFPGGQTAIIDNTDGDSVRLRSQPNKNGDVRGNIGAGAIVLITDGPKTDTSGMSWYQVQYAGQSGWVMSDFISARKLTGYAAVTFTDGDGISLRESGDAGGKVIANVPEGAVVQLLESPKLAKDGTPWYRVNHAGKQGYVMGTYLVPSTAASMTANSAAKTTTEATTGKAPDVQRDDRVKVVGTDGGGVRMRDEVGYTTEIVGTLDEGTVVTVIANTVTDSKGNEWVPISFDGQKGYVIGIYLAKTSDPATKRKALPGTPAASANAAGTPTSGTPTTSASGTPAAAATPESAPATATATGSKIVAEAMKYVGSPYVYGGTSPKGFDCSGFTLFNVKQVTGQTIPRSANAQIAAGQYVSKENLQPGDLVFFANTYAAGVSHAGIYIGAGRFVHAENEGTGVVVSSMSSSYYASKYYTARRLG